LHHQLQQPQPWQQPQVSLLPSLLLLLLLLYHWAIQHCCRQLQLLLLW
jgi:hypothetical protein